MVKTHKKSKHKSKENLKPRPRVNFKNWSSVCAYQCAQLSYTVLHRTVLTVFPLILRTIIIAQTLSSGGEGDACLNASHIMKEGLNLIHRLFMLRLAQYSRDRLDVYSRLMRSDEAEELL